jgi:hypothetical protein
MASRESPTTLSVAPSILDPDSIQPEEAPLMIHVHVVGSSASQSAAWGRQLEQSIDSCSEAIKDSISVGDSVPPFASRVLVFVESPETTVLETLRSGEVECPTAALDLWCKSAMHVVESIQSIDVKDRLIVEAAAATVNPARLVSTIESWEPRFALVGLPVLHGRSYDELAHLIAQRIVAQHPRASDLYATLLTLRTPMASGERPPLGIEVDVAEAARRFRALQSRPQEQHVQGMTPVPREVVESQALHAQLLRIQEELVRTNLKLLDEQARARSAQREIDSLRQLICERVEESERSIDPTGEDAILQRNALTAALRDEIKRQRLKHDRLLMTVHRLQAEVEEVALHRSSIFRSDGRNRDSSLDIQLTERNESTPHRHLHFEVRSRDSGAHRTKRSSIRLLEHFGRPGIGIFKEGAFESPLSVWQADGSEGDAQFMLLIPADPAGTTRLRRLGTSDWLTVSAIATALRDFTNRMANGLPAHWQQVASLLVTQLHNQSAHLRYDHLEVAPDQQNGSHVQWRVEFARTWFGNRELGDMALRWTVNGGRTTSLCIFRAPIGAEVPFSMWPVSGEGNLETTYNIPLISLSNGLTGGRAWLAMPTQDRQLLLELLDALQGMGPLVTHDEHREGLMQAARAFHRSVRRAMIWLKAVTALRRIATNSMSN